MPRSKVAPTSALGYVRKHFPDVRDMRDADEDINVHVTNEDVQTSKRKSHTKCAMAVACARQEHADGVVVSKTTAYVVKNNHGIRYHVPPNIRTELISFDRGAKFIPGDYTLKAVSAANRLGARAGRKIGKNVRRYGQTRPRRVAFNVRTSLPDLP